MVHVDVLEGAELQPPMSRLDQTFYVIGALIGLVLCAAFAYLLVTTLGGGFG